MSFDDATVTDFLIYWAACVLYPVINGVGDFNPDSTHPTDQQCPSSDKSN
jgi:hypothetical protein